MTGRERWEHWHWSTRASVGIGIITAFWILLAALFIPRREYEKDQSVSELRYVRDSARRAALDLKVERFIDHQNCVQFCATRPATETCACLRADR